MSTIRRRYQVLVDMDVQIRPFDRTTAMASWQSLMAHGPDDFRQLGVTAEEYVDRGERLLAGLLDDAAALNGWLEDETAVLATEGEVYEFDDDTLAHEQLAPVIPELPAEHRTYFEEMLAKDRFYEAAESFFAASGAAAVSLTIEEIPVPAPGREDVLVHRRYRATVDTDAWIDEIDPVDAQANLDKFRAQDVELDVSVSEYVAHARGLVDGLLRNEQALEVWLRDLAFKTVADFGAQSLRDTMTDDEILRPVIARMSPDDRAYFERSLARDLLYETIEGLHDAMVSEIVSVTVARSPEPPALPA